MTLYNVSFPDSHHPEWSTYLDRQSVPEAIRSARGYYKMDQHGWPRGMADVVEVDIDDLVARHKEERRRATLAEPVTVTLTRGQWADLLQGDFYTYEADEAADLIRQALK
jgi:hypothetical protein